MTKKKKKHMTTQDDMSLIKMDSENHRVVIIPEIVFKGRRNIDWGDVERYLKRYLGNRFTIDESNDNVYVTSDFPNEFKGSRDTRRSYGMIAKAKANASLQLPLIVKVGVHKRWQENFKDKHRFNAKFGWYRYTSRFALPVYRETGEFERYNVFRCEILVRHNEDGRLYLYDLVNVRKTAATIL